MADESLLDWWRYDLSLIVPMLAEFSRAPGKLAVIREPPAQHFAGGTYIPGRAGYVSEKSGCCMPLDAKDAYSNLNYHATHAVHEAVFRYGAGRVRILPWYNATLDRWQAHIGTRAACFERSRTAVSRSTAWTRKRECSCDCTHFCYSPLFYDATILTPLHAMLNGQELGQ